MRLRRACITAAAWMPAAVACALIVQYTRSHYPGALSIVAARLFGTAAPPKAAEFLSRFSDATDFDIWRREEAQLVQAGGWGRITFRKGVFASGIRLSDYARGPARLRDWSAYRWLRWDMRPLRETERPLVLMMKDDADRRFTREFRLPAGVITVCSVDLTEMVPVVDLTRMADVHFYMSQPPGDAFVDVKDLRLEKGPEPPGGVLGRPFVAFEKMTAPKTAALGEAATISFFLSVTSRQEIGFAAFVHLYPESEKEVRVPSLRRGYIHIERVPFVPVTEWVPGEAQEVGPFTVYFDPAGPPGKYLVRMGLFNPYSGGNGPRGIVYHGAYDYNGSYPKCRFTDPSIDDFVVGSVLVERRPRPPG